MNKERNIKVRITDEDYQSLKAVCQAEDVSMSALIRQRVRESLIPHEASEWE